MKKLAALLALSAAATTQALAADIVDYVPPPEEPVLVAAPTWTGLYVGGQLGGAFNAGNSGLPDIFVVIPGSPGRPGRDAVPATPFIPGNPGSPGRPAVPATPEQTVTLPGTEFSFACAGAGPAAACSGAIESGGVVTQQQLTRAELSAAIAAAGGDPNAALGAAVAVEIPGRTTVIPANPGSPAVDPVPATPDQPATSGSPAVEAIPATPEQRVPFASLPGVSSFNDDSDGFIGGVHIGYDYELAASLGGGTFVIGAVADLSYVDVERYGGLTDGVNTIAARQELDYLATARLRAGAGFDRVLVYATGGVAFGDVETTIVNSFVGGVSNSDTRVGYAVGAGADFLVAQNFSLGLEYLYTNLGSKDLAQTFNNADYGDLGVVSDDDFDFHTVWAKASFRFN
ncbi:outer membrane protein [Aureimonas sp. SK2]|uniref:outer membrane protein n=1 Tax=Aureimonas sp. SK2 TaxID=3015992 RepID=UPI0024438ED3|nr:outer membrane protein [Aureimonas sp. SK2]